MICAETKVSLQSHQTDVKVNIKLRKINVSSIYNHFLHKYIQIVCLDEFYFICLHGYVMSCLCLTTPRKIFSEYVNYDIKNKICLWLFSIQHENIYSFSVFFFVKLTLYERNQLKRCVYLVLDFYLDFTYVYIGVDVLLYHIKWSKEQCDDFLLQSIDITVLI